MKTREFDDFLCRFFIKSLFFFTFASATTVPDRCSPPSREEGGGASD